MVLKFGYDERDAQNLITSRCRLSDGSYRVYKVYIDDTFIGTTLGAYDHVIVINIVNHGTYIFDADALMHRMMKAMELSDLLAMGTRI